MGVGLVFGSTGIMLGHNSIGVLYGYSNKSMNIVIEHRCSGEL